VTFYYDTEQFPERHFSELKQMGLVADQVETVAPELVEDDGTGYKAVAYSRAVALVAAAVKELNEDNARKVEQLTQEVQELKLMVQRLLLLQAHNQQ
jgi:glycosyltransferase involved in cell wall biosynthesis